MAEKSGSRFYERQRFPLRRIGLTLLTPPCIMLGLLIWQVVLGHSWGKQPMSNGNLIGWTIFLWLIYVRLITVQLAVEVRSQEVLVGLRGLWRARHIALSDIRSVEKITYDPEREYGGYGIRSIAHGKAYIAGGNQGVRLKLADGETIVLGSQRPAELVDALSKPAK